MDHCGPTMGPQGSRRAPTSGAPRPASPQAAWLRARERRASHARRRPSGAHSSSSRRVAIVRRLCLGGSWARPSFHAAIVCTAAGSPMRHCTALRRRAAPPIPLAAHVWSLDARTTPDPPHRSRPLAPSGQDWATPSWFVMQNDAMAARLPAAFYPRATRPCVPRLYNNGSSGDWLGIPLAAMCHTAVTCYASE